MQQVWKETLMAGNSYIDEELRRKEVLQKSGNLTQMQPQPDIEPINKEQPPKPFLDATMTFFGVGETPEAQSYEEYRKKQQTPTMLDKFGGVVLDAAESAIKAGKAVGKAAKDIKYQIVTPKYQQEEGRKRGRKP